MGAYALPHDGKKTRMDPGAVIYVFRNGSIGIHKDILHQNWESEPGKFKTHYTEFVAKRMTNDNLVATYYKRVDEKWVDLLALRRNYFRGDLFQVAEAANGLLFEVPSSCIPDVDYIDSDRCIHEIVTQDGSLENVIPSIFMDTGYFGDIEVKQVSVENPTFGFNLRHLCDDVEITLLKDDVTNEDFLVWLNGVFVPIIHHPTDSKKFYIRNAIPFVNTRAIDHDPTDQIQPHRPNPNTARLVENERKEIYRYRFDIRLFGWKDIGVSKWATLDGVQTEPIVHNHKAVYIPKVIFFSEPVSKNHMIFENGICLSHRSYRIDPTNPHKVELLDTIPRGKRYINDLISEGHPNPIQRAKEELTRNQYGMVNFSNRNPEITDINIVRDRSAIPNYPYARDITFRWVDIGDLVLINGIYIPYLWTHNNRLSIPRFDFSNPKDDIEALRSAEIERVTFYFSGGETIVP